MILFLFLLVNLVKGFSILFIFKNADSFLFSCLDLNYLFPIYYFWVWFVLFSPQDLKVHYLLLKSTHILSFPLGIACTVSHRFWYDMFKFVLNSKDFLFLSWFLQWPIYHSTVSYLTFMSLFIFWSFSCYWVLVLFSCG